MPIEKEFDYANEAEFTDRFLVPLLRRMGFSIVLHYHGGKEFGKDLVFGEIDRFGQVAYHGLQAKYVPSIGLNDSDGLVQDAKQAFNNAFRHPSTGAEERLSTFYAVNGGTISDEARTHFFNSLGTPHGGHVRLLDGKGLLALDRWGSLGQVGLIRETLSGLRLELQYNNLWAGLLSERLREFVAKEGKPLPLEQLRTAATSGYLQRPLVPTHIDTNVVLSYWHAAENQVNNTLRAMGGVRPMQNKLELAQVSLTILSEIQRLGDAITVSIDTVLQQLEPLARL